MKRPSFQFYPGDWRRDPALCSCSMAARGLWIDMMCIAHESEEYGVLSLNDKPMTVQQISRVVGEVPAVVAKLIDELESSGVFSRNDRGAIFSRRMVKDEAVRNTRAAGGEVGKEFGQLGAEHGRKGGRPRKETGDSKTPLKTPLNHPLADEENPPPSSSSSSSISSSIPNTVKGSSLLLVAKDPEKPDAAVAATPNHRGSRLPKDWVLPKAWGDWALTEFPAWTPDVVRIEAEKFCDHWAAKAGKDGAKADWAATWRNWCRNSRAVPVAVGRSGVLSQSGAQTLVNAAALEARIFNTEEAEHAPH